MIQPNEQPTLGHAIAELMETLAEQAVTRVRAEAILTDGDFTDNELELIRLAGMSGVIEAVKFVGPAIDWSRLLDRLA